MSRIPVLVDGPNFINRLLDLGILPMHLARQLSLEGLREAISRELVAIPQIQGTCDSVEFFCSKKLFGSSAKKFSQPQQDTLLNRFRREIGVHVDAIDLPGSSEKGVDITISGKLEDYATTAPAIVLVTTDRDFVPALRKLRHKTKVALVEMSNEYPVELQNEAYCTLAMAKNWHGLFRYRYPQFRVRDLTHELCAELFSEADERVDNQLRLNENGYVYLSHIDTGAQNTSDLQCRWETLSAYNGYVGPKVASDSEYVSEQFNQIVLAWKRKARGYIDYPVQAVWRDDNDDDE